MDKIEKHIQTQINKLNNNKADTRYEGCEFLRAAPLITEEAKIALLKAVNDPDKEVADAAKRALEVHEESKPEIISPPKENGETKRTRRSRLVMEFACGFIVWFVFQTILIFKGGFMAEMGIMRTNFLIMLLELIPLIVLAMWRVEAFLGGLMALITNSIGLIILTQGDWDFFIQTPFFFFFNL
jgi:hypothetical protein